MRTASLALLLLAMLGACHETAPPSTCGVAEKRAWDAAFPGISAIIADDVSDCREVFGRDGTAKLEFRVRSTAGEGRDEVADARLAALREWASKAPLRLPAEGEIVGLQPPGRVFFFMPDGTLWSVVANSITAGRFDVVLSKEPASRADGRLPRHQAQLSAWFDRLEATAAARPGPCAPDTLEGELFAVNAHEVNRWRAAPASTISPPMLASYERALSAPLFGIRAVLPVADAQLERDGVPVRFEEGAMVAVMEIIHRDDPSRRCFVAASGTSSATVDVGEFNDLASAETKRLAAKIAVDADLIFNARDALAAALGKVAPRMRVVDFIGASPLPPQ